MREGSKKNTEKSERDIQKERGATGKRKQKSISKSSLVGEERKRKTREKAGGRDQS